MSVAQGATPSAQPECGRRSPARVTLRTIALVTLTMLAPLSVHSAASAEPTEPTKMFQVGIVAFANPRSASFFVVFEQRLRELGYIEGKTLAVD